jgi:putative flippase GtrA
VASLAIGRCLRSELGQKGLKYLAVSALSITITQAVLALAFGVFEWRARMANLVAFVSGGIPAYVLNRRWTWQKTGRSHLAREVLPFWAMAFLGLALSTLAVGVAEDAAPEITEARGLQTLFVVAASLAAYGAVWAGKFIAFDRLLFGERALLVRRR